MALAATQVQRLKRRLRSQTDRLKLFKRGLRQVVDEKSQLETRVAVLKAEVRGATREGPLHNVVVGHS